MLIRGKSLSRAGVLALLSATAFSLAGAGPTHAASPQRESRPLLATPEQIEGERLLLDLLKDPEIKALQSKIRSDLAQTAIGQTSDGAARIDYAVDEWTRSLIFKEIIGGRPTPAILWATDDTPRTWLGYTLGGVGTSGDNPDFIYRAATVDGSGRYEIVGRFDPELRTKQFVLQVVRAQSAAMPLAKNHADLGNHMATLTDRDLVVKPDGSFRVTLGGSQPADSPNHLAIEPGEITIGFRDVLSDWKQRPARLAIHRLDADTVVPLDRADVRKRVLAKLADYVALWSHYPEQWFGGLKPNSIATPVPREGGWGYMTGLRFQLKPDEALLVTTDPHGAGYAGFQVVDPWMIASSAKAYQTSLNLSQAKPNADGTYSYVIAPRDPGVANWLDSSGLHDGYAVLRWQVLPADIKGETLLRDFRVIKLADAARIPGVALTAPERRKADLAVRAEGYGNRTR